MFLFHVKNTIAKLQISIDVDLETKSGDLSQSLNNIGCEVVYGKIGSHLIFIPPSGWILLLHADTIKTGNNQNFKDLYLDFFKNHPLGVVIIEKLPRFGEKKQNLIQETLLEIFSDAPDQFHGFIPSLGEEDTAFCLKSIAWRLQVEDKPPILARINSSTPYLWKGQEIFIEGLLNCGPVKAKALLEKFDTPMQIFNTILNNPEKILAIKGFGQKFINRNLRLIQDYLSNFES
jgi:hypothetical protein